MSAVLLADDIAERGLFDRLKDQPADPLLALIGLYRDDPRPQKIDLGVGVYRDAGGRTPVMRAAKQAEAVLLREQASKSYLGPEGDARFIELLEPIALGAGLAGSPLLTGMQAPGGTGALRIAAELVALADRDARVWIGTPTWPNHGPIFEAAGLTIQPHAFFDKARQSLLFDRMMHELEATRPGDVILLHGCCHNPAGIEMPAQAWEMLTDLILRRGLLPIVDLAYQGLGEGLDEDAANMRALVERVPAAIIAYSCDKNFGLYRERVGALWAKGPNATLAARIRANMLMLARANWSMPPDHGAAVVHTILEDGVLAAHWRAELEDMRSRIASLRATLAASHPRLAPLADQQGMFSLLPLSPEDVLALRRDHGIYMAASGRINIAGLRAATIPLLARALAPYL